MAAFGYGGAVRRAIHALKYEDRPDLAWPLGRALAERGRAALTAAPGAVVVPVPSHRVRLAERGYNPVALVGRALCGAAGLRLEHALRRPRWGGPQASRSAGARRALGADQFTLARGARPGSAWLLDDVVTTGTTVARAAETLRGGGYRVAGVLAVALVLLEHAGVDAPSAERPSRLLGAALS